jgi:hypothetical protein
MALSLQHRYAVLLADRTRDIRTNTTVVTEVLEADADTTPLDIETALRTANGQAYLGPVDNLPNRIFAVGGFPW